MIRSSVKISLAALRARGKSIDNQLHGRAQGDLTKVFQKWAVRYRAFVQQRFVSASRGDGTWAALSSRTIANRRQGSSVILRDTNALFAALTPVWDSPPGGLNKFIDGGVEVGFGGGAGHPSGFATIAEIASYHQEGAGNLPKRQIIIPPSQAMMDGCVADLQKVL